MSSVEQQVASCVVNSVWEVAVIGGAGWLVSRAVRRFGPRVEHVVWVMTLGPAVVTPGLPMVWAAVRGMMARPLAEGATVRFAVAGAAGSPVARRGFAVPEAVILGLLVLFGVAVAYFAVRLCWRVGRVVRLRRSAEPVVLGEDLEQAWGRCRRAFGVEGARILRSRHVAGPVTAGFWKPVVMVPDGFLDGCREGDFVAAMAHECAHIRRGDFGKNLLYEMAGVVIGYHPVTWFVKARLAQTREMICDEMASETVLDAYSYAASLLRLAEKLTGGERVAASPAMGIFDADALERRIRRMKEKKFQVSGRVRGMVTGASMVLLFCVAGALSAMAGTVHAQTKEGFTSVAGTKLHLYAGATCTYYDLHTRAHAGTCATRPGDAGEYFCAENGSEKFQPQIGCKAKVEWTRGAEAAEPAAKKERGAEEQATGSDGNVGKVYAIGKDVTAPIAIFTPEPKYTKKARLAKYQGIVDLQIIVTKQGLPADIKVVRHLGMGLDEKAVEAVKQYRFKPAMYHGHPVAVKMIVEVLFHLY
jgi:TonB family protein